MNSSDVEKALKGVPLGGSRYFTTIGSTNDEALAWAAGSASDLSLVLADAQTNGRGRNGRVWLSQPDSSLTFSLILKPTPSEQPHTGRFSFLGALALARVLRNQYKVPAQIKWPNDVLISDKKVSGILAEAVWTGADVDSIVLGIGINLLSDAYPPDVPLNFPAGCLQQFCAAPPTRLQLLRELLLEIQALRPQIADPSFIRGVQEHLALLNQTVMLITEGEPAHRVRVKHLQEDGSLLVTVENGGFDKVIHQGEVHFLP